MSQDWTIIKQDEQPVRVRKVEESGASASAEWKGD
jgi:hypothetical protein